MRIKRLTDYEKERIISTINGMDYEEKSVALQAILKDRGLCIEAFNIVNNTLVIQDGEIVEEPEKEERELTSILLTNNTKKEGM